eukprot:2020491-Amphidinium_carterae.3
MRIALTLRRTTQWQWKMCWLMRRRRRTITTPAGNRRDVNPGWKRKSDAHPDLIVGIPHQTTSPQTGQEQLPLHVINPTSPSPARPSARASYQLTPPPT